MSHIVIGHVTWQEVLKPKPKEERLMYLSVLYLEIEIVNAILHGYQISTIEHRFCKAAYVCFDLIHLHVGLTESCQLK